MFGNLKEMLSESALQFGERAAFRFKTGRDSVKEVSYSEFKAQVDSLGTYLLTLGLKDRHVAVLSENRYEWLVSYLAVINGTGVVVPIDRELPGEAILKLLKEGDVEAVLYSKTYEEIFTEAGSDAPRIRISFDREDDGGEELLSYEKALKTGGDLLKAGDDSFTKAVIDSEKTAAILFTSGTTGISKGVMLSHKNITSNIFGATAYEKYGQHEIMLSILPYHHCFELTVGIMASLAHGATICINDSMKYIMKNFSLFKPTAVYLVPAIVNAMVKQIAQAEKSLGRKLTEREAAEAFGGRLTRIYSGSAPLNPELIGIFRGYGIKLCQGYGLTETSPVVSTAKYDLLNEQNADSAGKIIPNCAVKIEDGEICVKGDNVMLGYYKNPEATNEVLRDGWLKTGDLGDVDENGLLYIRGRKKNVIIASGGENVYPEELERYLYESPLVADALVHGGDSPDKETVTAVIYPNEDALAGKSGGEAEEIIKAEVMKINEGLPIYKQILCVTIRKQPFEKTTAGKIKRDGRNYA